MKIVLTCESNHVQTVDVGGMAREWIETVAKMMDGSHPLLSHVEDSLMMIGKCCLPGYYPERCGRQLKATIQE